MENALSNFTRRTSEDGFRLAVAPPRPLAEDGASPRRREILDGLERLILTNGFRSLRLTEVGKTLGTSYATLYQIAASKDELITFVIERFYQRTIRAALRELAKQHGPLERLEYWVSFGVSGVGVTSREFWADVDSHPLICSRINDYRHFYVEVLEEIIRDGMDRGAFRPVNAHLVAVAWEVTSMRLGDADLVDHRPLEELAREWVDFVLHGLLPR